ncbi:MAG: zinc ribbon domain-containing protein [Candidatus Borkfalkiaceae bacterium]|nr:zinc ribbon domain-containing protein [Christensenellaceae bacterium]
MRLLQFYCPNCGKKSEEFVRADNDKFYCKDCGAELKRDYSGKIFGLTGKQSDGCSGDCSRCSGCKH